jgi:RNA polymerase sigma-70 factor (ECF subfamily)
LPTDDSTTLDAGVALAESVSMAFLVALEALSPVERAVLVLHDVFEHEHEEIAAMLERSPAACRQSLHRARERVRARAPRFATSPEQHEAVVLAFGQCLATGDLATLTAMLSRDVVVISDSDGKASAARKPVHGADPCARMLIGLAKKGAAAMVPELRRLNGALAFVMREGTAATSTLVVETDGEVIYGVYITRNPEKLLWV